MLKLMNKLNTIDEKLDEEEGEDEEYGSEEEEPKQTEN